MGELNYRVRASIMAERVDHEVSGRMRPEQIHVPKLKFDIGNGD